MERGVDGCLWTRAKPADGVGATWRRAEIAPNTGASLSAIGAEILALAAADPAVAAAAEVGSFAAGVGDRWSDLYLTFAVSPGTALEAVLQVWTQRLKEDADAVVLFDLASGPAIYRVFLFPDALQVDLSFAPAAEFRPRGPAF